MNSNIDQTGSMSVKDEKRANTGGAPSGLTIGIIAVVVGGICFVAVVCTVVLGLIPVYLSGGSSASSSNSSNNSSNRCGVRPSFSNNGRILKIVGGKDAFPNSWPWQVALSHRDRSSLCGASLINNQWLLTAAHCFVGKKNISARLGVYDLDKVSAGNSIIKVAKHIPHPDYNSRTFLNDIQLLKLDSPVTFSSVISPICLPAGDSFNIGDILTVTGWGRLGENGQISNILQEVNVTVNPNNVCTQQFKLPPLENTQLCAGDFTPIHDSCQGDSGGPLVKFDQASNQYWQVGIVSYGVGCRGHGVYTNIVPYMKWVNDTLAAN